MLTVSRQNNSCQEGWTICNGRGLIHHLLYPTPLYLFYLKVLFINQFCFYWWGNLSFFIMCHYATPFAAITAVIRPQVYPPTQTLRHGGGHYCLVLPVFNAGDMGKWREDRVGRGGKGGGATRIYNERGLRKEQMEDGGQWSMERFELRKGFSCSVISSYQPAKRVGNNRYANNMSNNM